MIDPNPLIRAIRPVVDAVGATFIPAAEAEASVTRSAPGNAAGVREMVL